MEKPVLEKPVLAPGEQLTAGEQIRSSNQRYIVRYQEDGNVVLYDTSDNSSKWSSGTLGAPPGKFRMQEDGNLVVYAAAGQAVWNSGTLGAKNVSAVVQGDGNFVLYSHDGASVIAVWDAWSDNARRHPTHTGGGTGLIKCGWETVATYDFGTDSWDIKPQWVCR